jgi:hypothetical protein
VTAALRKKLEGLDDAQLGALLELLEACDADALEALAAVFTPSTALEVVELFDALVDLRTERPLHGQAPAGAAMSRAAFFADALAARLRRLVLGELPVCVPGVEKPLVMVVVAVRRDDDRYELRAASNCSHVLRQELARAVLDDEDDASPQLAEVPT